jgi:hypothetical protein
VQYVRGGEGWPDELENAGWEYGSNLAYMKPILISKDLPSGRDLRNE